MAAEVDRQKYLKGGAPTGGDILVYKDNREAGVLKDFEKRNDFEAARMKRLLSFPDLARKTNSPVKFVVDRILGIPEFRNFDVLEIPETVTLKDGFDAFNIPPDHPIRRPTDSYFINAERLLRPQTTAMWFYYFSDPEKRALLEKQGHLGALCFGKVYRKDEIDRNHFPVFHQIDGLYVTKKADEEIKLETLQKVLSGIIQSVFGANVEFRFLDDSFPFTDPSTQIEIKRGNDWIEVVGGGLVHKNVLSHFGLDPEIYHGWAFGFGLERLTMIKNNIHDIRVLWSDDPRAVKQFTSIDSQYKEVSKYPAVTRDISFIVRESFVPNDYFDLIRDIGGDLVEEVSLLDKYENEQKFGKGKMSYAYRIIYRSNDRTLTNDEVDALHKAIEKKTAEEYGATIR